MKSLGQIENRVPQCCLTAVEACLSDATCDKRGSIRAGVEHELELFREGENNITPREAHYCERFLKWMDEP